MKCLNQIFKFPIQLLEHEYWKESGFCLSCKRFNFFNEEFAIANVCPFCKEKEFYDVDFLIYTGILIGTD